MHTSHSLANMDGAHPSQVSHEAAPPPPPPIEGMPVVIAGLLPAVFLWYPIKYTWEEGDDVLTGLTEKFLAAKRVR